MNNKKLKIYIDGGSRGNPGLCACAAIIMDESEKIIGEEGRFLGFGTNNFAEYSALHLALSVAKKLGAKEIDIYSDSELLVKQYNKEYSIKDENLKEMMNVVVKELISFKAVNLIHIKRTQNKLADKLVNNILDTQKLSKEENLQIAEERKRKFKREELF